MTVHYLGSHGGSHSGRRFGSALGQEDDRQTFSHSKQN